MTVKVKYLGISTGKTNHELQHVQLPENSDIEKLLNIINDKLEISIDTLLKYAIFLVNQSKANKYTVLNDGDEVFILYSLSGG